MGKNTKNLQFKGIHGSASVSPYVRTYAANGRIFVGLVSHDAGYPEPYTDITVNLPEHPLISPTDGFISDGLISSKDMLWFITENHLGKILPGWCCGYSMVRFDLNQLAKYDPEGVAEYRRHLGKQKSAAI